MLGIFVSRQNQAVIHLSICSRSGEQKAAFRGDGQPGRIVETLSNSLPRINNSIGLTAIKAMLPYE